ncbi:MAG TPA: hypothetical protein VFE04_10065, partial [Puia sp.]|nr:hypothetical protein [Puia sp.]
MKTRLRKIIFRFLILPVILLIILVFAATAVLYNQQPRLVALAVRELNKKLPGKLIVGGSEISVFQNYPYISIAVKNVRLFADKDTTGKTIFEAEKIFVGFNLTDVLNQQYRAKVILLKNGCMDIVKDNGRLNIMDALLSGQDSVPQTTDTTKALDFVLKKLVLKNMDISFFDKQSREQVHSHIDRIQSSFSTDSLQMNAELQGAMVLDYLWPGDSSLLRNKRLETDIKLSYHKSSGILSLQEGKLKLEDAMFNITGTADLLHNNQVDLKFSGDKTDFRQLFAFAPPKLAKELKHFKYDGHLDFKGTVKGKLQGGNMPRIDLYFSCKNGWLHNTESRRKLDSLAFKGFYTNGSKQSLQTSELRLLDFNARPDKGIFK